MPSRVAPSRRRLRGSSLLLFGLGLATPWAGCLSWSSLETGACGDSFVGREEACDDGNRISGDGCSDACRLEPAVCGDGRQDPGEGCDDGNAQSDDACLADCQTARCGDGQIWKAQEQCDDGNAASGDGCSAACRLEPAPTGPRCGNARLDSDEACDDGNLVETDACLAGCSWAACGDGRIRTGVEECDDGNASNLDDCMSCVSCAQGPSSYFRLSNAHCYTVHEATTAQKARAICQKEGGDLWTLTSESESMDVTAKLALKGSYWLGLLTTSTGNTWVSGDVPKFTSFAPGEPSDVGLGCVVLDTATAPGRWSSEACASQFRFVCERAPAFVFGDDHHAYRLHTETVDAKAAQQNCSRDGGHLVALETETERVFVGKNVSAVVWVNADDAATEGVFLWPNGERLDPSAFGANQPDDTTGTQGCVLFNQNHRFMDTVCGEQHAYLCEFE